MNLLNWKEKKKGGGETIDDTHTHTVASLLEAILCLNSVQVRYYLSAYCCDHNQEVELSVDGHKLSNICLSKHVVESVIVPFVAWLSLLLSAKQSDIIKREEPGFK